MSTSHRKRSIRELAAEWGLSVSQIKRLVYHRDPKERLPFVRINGRIRFEASEIERWLEARREREPVPAKDSDGRDAWAEEPGAARYVN